MYKRILVAMDGSDTSDRALREAVGLAREQGAALRVVSAIEGFRINEYVEFPAPEDLEQTQEQAVLDLLEKARRVALESGVGAEIHLLRIERLGQRIADAVVADAKDWPADLIVAGTHGRSGFDHLLMGSVAEGIVRIAPVPILLVRAA